MKAIRLVSDLQRNKNGEVEFNYRLVPDKMLNKLTQEKMLKKLGFNYKDIDINRNNLEDYVFSESIVNVVNGGFNLTKPKLDPYRIDPKITISELMFKIIPVLLHNGHLIATTIIEDKLFYLNKKLSLAIDETSFTDKDYFDINEIDLAPLSDCTCECFKLKAFLGKTIDEPDFVNKCSKTIIVKPTVIKTITY